MKNIAYLIGGIVLGVALTFAVIKVNSTLGTDSDTDKTAQNQAKSAAPANTNNTAVKTVSIADGPVLGDKAKVKVAIVEFSDYECTFCKRFNDQTFESIKKDYVDTGKVIFVYRNYPLPFHDPAATTDANAAECVKEIAGDVKYYEMGELLYKNSGLNGKGIEKEKMIALAEQLGVNKNKFTDCYDSQKFKGKIENDKKDAASAGIQGTPAFIIGQLDKKGNVAGELVSGAQPYASFKDAIERQLSK